MKLDAAGIFGLAGLAVGILTATGVSLFGFLYWTNAGVPAVSAFFFSVALLATVVFVEWLLFRLIVVP